MKNYAFALLFSVFAIFSCSKNHEILNPMPASDRSGCDSPSNVTLSWPSPNSPVFGWDAAGGAVQYKIGYTLQGALPSPDYYTTRTSYRFLNLQPGTYDFRIATDCAGGSVSEYIIIEDIIVSD